MDYQAVQWQYKRLHEPSEPVSVQESYFRSSLGQYVGKGHKGYSVKEHSWVVWYFSLTILWRILMSTRWFWGHFTCVIQLVFVHILFSLKHLGMTQLWDIIFKLNIHFLIQMESLSMEYLLCECMQARKSCHITESSLINW